MKFFRNIRQKLLKESPLSRYTVYAVGEIILVVFGILIALGINNWNQSRIDFAKEEGYLSGLQIDLKRQIAFFDFYEDFCDEIILLGESILTDFNTFGRLTEIDSLNSKLTRLMYTQKYPEISTTFNELNSTGQLNLIRKKTARTQIVGYYQKADFHRNSINGNMEEVIYPEIFPIIKSMVTIIPENFGMDGINLSTNKNLKSSLEERLNDENKSFDLINAISLRIIIAKVDRSILNEAKNDAETLLSVIDEELKSH